MKKKLILTLSCILLLIIPSLLSGCINQNIQDTPSKTSYETVLLTELKDSIGIASDYLTNSTYQNGMLVYEYNPMTNINSLDNYNILRHAGTIYSMVKLYNETKKEQLLQATENAISYLNQQIKSYNDTKCIVYNDEVKLGGNALGIIALTEYYLVTENESTLSTLRDLGKYLLLSQKPNGDFIHKRYYSTNITSDFISQYYPGEAILALCRLYKVTQNQTWLDAAEKATDYLINIRDKDETVYSIIHDHWLLMALNELYRYRDNSQYYNHSKLISISILAYQRDDFTRFSEEPAWLGSYYTPPRSTPTATRTEGLVASYHLFNDYDANQSYMKRMLYSINLSIHFQLQMQYTQESLQLKSLPDQALGGFKSSFDEPTIRIDYVQHNICSIIEFYHILKEDPTVIEQIQEFKDSQSETQLNCSILEQSLDLGSQYLMNNQREQGNFNYEYDFFTQTQSDEDNEVRQAGAIWGLSLMYQKLQQESLKNSYLNAYNFFKLYSNEDGSKQWVSYPDGDSIGSTGTVALLCLSIIDFLRSSPSINSTLKNSLKLNLDKYLNFLLSVRMDNGLFHQNYYLSNGSGFGSPSPYYDGESLLALCKAYNYQGQTQLKGFIKETAFVTYQNHIVNALDLDEDSDTTKGFFQWGIMSYYEILQTDWDNIENYSVVILSLADWMIDIHKTLERTRNTAYAYEGIIHAYQVAVNENDSYHMTKFKNVIDTGLYKLTTWQVNGPIPNEYLQDRQTSDSLAIGGILNHKEEPFLRIDVTQHQMHAVILAMDYVYNCV